MRRAAPADVGIGEDHGERLPQLVRQGGSELAEGSNACDVLQLRPLLRGSPPLPCEPLRPSIRQSFGPVPSSRTHDRARESTGHAVRSLHTIFHFVFAPRWSAPSIAFSRATRSSGCTRSNVAPKSRRASGPRPNSYVPARSSTRRCRKHPRPTSPGLQLPWRDPSGSHSHARFFRASFLFDHDRQQHQRSGGHQEEQL